MKQRTADWMMTIIVAFFIAAILWSVKSEGAEYETGPLGPYDMTQVDKVYDGDTFYGWTQTFIYQTTYMKVRIKTIDTPEIRGTTACEKKLGYAARDYLNYLLASAKTVTLDELEYDSFGRVLALVHADHINVAAKMIEMGHARPYVKGGGGAWCLRG